MNLIRSMPVINHMPVPRSNVAGPSALCPRRKHGHFITDGCIVVFVLLLSAAPAAAQTGPALLLRPWPHDGNWQLDTGAFIVNKGHTDNADARFRLTRYDVSGRWRERPENTQPQSAKDKTFTVGFEATYLNLSTQDAALPDRLVDQSVAAGFDLSQEGNLKLVLGVGYAGNNPFADDEALYGQASLVYTHVLDPQTLVRVILNYDGHGVIFPDVPLPSIVYQHQFSDTISYSLGFPINTLHWRPTDRLVLRLMYVLPVSVQATIEYELAEGWTLFGQIDSRLDAFTIDGARDQRRLFFQQRTFEAGIRLRSDQNIDLALAVGYAFGQEFSIGHDVRDLDDIADPSDEPYFRVAVNVRF